MKSISFMQIKEKYHLGQAQTVQVCERARFKKMVPGNPVPKYNFYPVEISMIVKRLKESIAKTKGVYNNGM